MQTSPLNIWGLPLAEVTPNATVTVEAGFEGILNQVVPAGETLTAGILGETGLEAGSSGPIALDQELDQATESQTSSDLIAMVMSGAYLPKSQEIEPAGLPGFAQVSSTSEAVDSAPTDLLGKKEVRLSPPVRVQESELASVVQLPDGFEALDQPEAFEGNLPQIPSGPTNTESTKVFASTVQAKNGDQPADFKPEELLGHQGSRTLTSEAGTTDLKTAEQKAVEVRASVVQGSAVDAALPEVSLPIIKSGDPIGQLLNERWQAWVKQNYAGPLAPQNPAPLMPAAMNTAFSAAAQSGQITLAQSEVKPVLSAAPVYAAAVTREEGTAGSEEVEAPASVQANPNMAGVLSPAIKTAAKPMVEKSDAFIQADSSAFEEELTEALEFDQGTVDKVSQPSSEQASVQGKDQVQTQSRPLNLAEERAVVKQASQTLEQMIAAKLPKTMVIRMNPDDLGSLTIKVRQIGRRVEAEVSASLDTVRNALSNQKQDLAAAVENRGAQLTSLVIKSESAGSESQTNNSFNQQTSSGDGRSHQESQQEADRLARLAASHSNLSPDQPARTKVRAGSISSFDLRA